MPKPEAILVMPADFSWRLPVERYNAQAVAGYWQQLGCPPNATLQQLMQAADALVADDQLHAYASFLYYQAIEDPNPQQNTACRPFVCTPGTYPTPTATAYQPRMSSGAVEQSFLPPEILQRAPLLAAVVLLTGVPNMLQWLARRGWMAMLPVYGQRLADHIRDTLDYFNSMPLAQLSWGLHYIHGEILCIGSLCFIPEWQTGLPTLPQQNKPSAQYDALKLAVHIPSGVNLSPAALHATFTGCQQFVLAHPYLGLPEVYTCHSWMLSPQLPELLPPGSRVLAYYNYYIHMPFKGNSGGFYRFVLRCPEGTPVEKLPRQTHLQRQVVDRIAQGNPPQTGLGMRLFGGDNI